MNLFPEQVFADAGSLGHPGGHFKDANIINIDLGGSKNHSKQEVKKV